MDKHKGEEMSSESDGDWVNPRRRLHWDSNSKRKNLLHGGYRKNTREERGNVERDQNDTFSVNFFNLFFN
jgi:hypothetical protein